MNKQVDFYFDFGSPTSYLAYTQIGNLAKQTGAAVNYKPILLGGVFAATGNRAPGEVPAKGKWMIEDLECFAQHYNVPYRWNSHFPINTLPLMRGAVFAQQHNFLTAYSDAIFRAMWVDNINMADPKEIGAVLKAAGLDEAKIIAGVAEPAVKDALKKITEEAVQRGVFGAPTFFIGDRMIFGQDRLMFVEAALKN
jgi:2-hydroxychromene-2-carboxylate isomerase